MSDVLAAIYQCRCRLWQDHSDPAVTDYHQVNLLLSCLNKPQRRWFVSTLSQQHKTGKGTLYQAGTDQHFAEGAPGD